MLQVAFERLIAAFARRSPRPQGETFASVAPCDFVVALNQLDNPVGTQLSASLHLLLVVRRSPSFLPQSVNSQVGVKPFRVWDDGQNFFKSWRNGDENALKKVVALAIGLGMVADTAVDFQTRLRELSFRESVRLAPVAPIPIQPNAHKHLSRSPCPVLHHRHDGITVPAVSDERHIDGSDC